MNKKYGVMLVFATAIISGFSIFINKFSVANIDSSVFTFMKNIIVAVFLLSILLLTKEIKTIKGLTKKQWLKLTAIGFVGGSIPFLLFFKGLQIGSAATSAFVHKTLFIYASVFALVFLKEKLNKKMVIAALFLLAGNLLLLKLKSFSFGRGELLVLIATLFWAGENVLSKHALRELSGNVVAFGRMFFGSLFILIFLAAIEKMPLIFNLSFSAVIWVIITSVILLLFVATYYTGLKHIKVSTATSILLLGSPITTLLSLVFPGGNLALSQLLGILMILLGVLIAVFFVEFSELKAPIAFQPHTHNV